MAPSFSVDGLDIPVQNVGDARRVTLPSGRGGPNGEGAFISHKTKHAALRYFVCLHVRDPIIVAAGGGYPAGHFVDITIARRDIVPAMLPEERGIADGGYCIKHCKPFERARSTSTPRSPSGASCRSGFAAVSTSIQPVSKPSSS
jgi:hypothetical protein